MSFHFKQIVIGSGTSALSFLWASRHGDNARFKSERTAVIGESDLWRETGSAPGGDSFEMGQTASHLHPISQPAANAPKINHLMQTHQYNAEMATLKHDIDNDNSGIKFIYDRVTKVNKKGAQYSLETYKRRHYTADQVIIASGPGSSKIPSKAQVTNATNHVELHNPHFKRCYDEIADGVTYVSTNQPPHSLVNHANGEPFLVAIEGGSATAAWVAAQAVRNGATHIFWMARSGFDAANPAGRNSPVMLLAAEKKWMHIAQVADNGVEVLDKCQLGEPRIRLTIKAGKNTANRILPMDVTFGGGLNAQDMNTEKTIDVHQYIHAFGLDPMSPGGPAQILNQQIRDELEVCADNDRRFGDNPDDTIIAYATRDKNLWIVGASVFRALGLGGRTNAQLRSKYANISNIFCQAGTPPEGIAVTKASIKAVTSLFQDKANNFNWNTIDLAELTRLIKKESSPTNGEAQCRKLAELIIKDRQQKVHPWDYEDFHKRLVANGQAINFTLT